MSDQTPPSPEPPQMPEPRARRGFSLRPRRGPKVILPPGERDTSPEARRRQWIALAGWGLVALVAGWFLYTAFTMGPTVRHPPPRIESFVASGHRGASGAWEVVLTWTTSNAESAEITPYIGQVEPEGRKELQIQNDTTFVMTATGPGGTATYELQVQVTEP
jgi:hypothetical protein